MRQALKRTSHTLEHLGLSEFDAVCMFSVITHQAPEEAEKIFSMLHPCVSEGGKLYFTAFIDQTVDGYIERDPANPGMLSTYNAEPLLEILATSGWTVFDVFPPRKISANRVRLPAHAPLEEALRIDVDRNANPAARLGRRGQHGAQEALQVRRARRLGGEAEAIAFAQDRDRRLGRPEQDDLVLLRAARRAARRARSCPRAGHERLAPARARALPPRRGPRPKR